MKHEISGEGSCEISAYKLSACDTDTERRNFAGYETHTPGQAMIDEVTRAGTTHTRG